ncbi:unnamed protein product [Agarophyton chilense]
MLRPAPAHLVVHYHRPYHDYYNWCLTLGDNVYAQCIPDAFTAYGALFRISLPSQSQLLLQPTHPALIDSTPRRVDLSSLHSTGRDKHVFLLCDHPHAVSSPLLFLTGQFSRFVFVTADWGEEWLVLYAGNTKRDLFPATCHYRVPAHPSLFVLDTSALPKEISFTLQKTHTYTAPSHSQPSFPSFEAPFPHHIPLSSTPFRTPFDPLSVLVEQTSRSAYLSLIVSTMAPVTRPNPSPVIAPSKHLILFYYRLDRSTPIVSIMLTAATNLQSVSLPSPYHTARAFSIDITQLLQLKNSKSKSSQLSIVPIRTSVSSTIQEPPLTWKPSLGLRIIYAQSYPRLLTPSDVDISIVYHRYDPRWTDWELNIWTNATEKYPALSTKLTPRRPAVPGQIVFHLIGHIFPFKTQVYAEPVRMQLHPAQATIDQFGHTVMTEPHRDACRRDVVREWTSAEAPAQILHFVQGDPKIRVRPPEPHQFMAKRWFRVRYRRFSPSDYNGWDLWTWDPTDPASHRVALAPVSVTKDWTDFIVDRASYGSAKNICLLPRRGGKAWLERDGVERVWNASLLEDAHGMEAKGTESDFISTDTHNYDEFPTFTITQDTTFVLRSLDEVKCMLDAYVDSEHSVVVSTPVPLGWICPTKKAAKQLGQNVCIKLCGHPVQLICKEGNLSYNQVTGKSLRHKKSEQLSTTKTRLMFETSVVHFDEDFLVENVIVCVHPFHAVGLHWERHQNEDRYFYEGSLGWSYSARQCVFRCFAPAADKVSVVIYAKATGAEGRVVVPMRRIPQGCWKAIVSKDLKGAYYKLLAEGKCKRLFPGLEVIDPYSRCNTAHAGRGLIYGTETTPVHDRPSLRAAEIIIYELHIRDMTIENSSGIRNGGKFLGLAERGTKMVPTTTKHPQRKPLTPWEQEIMPGVQKDFFVLEKFSSGLDHIAQMGVTAIQIMPIQDFDNNEDDEFAYRWGYMPVHFNSPDGWYASSTHTAARVKEFKKLVSAAHKAGLRVIMDVVYNHTAEDSNELNLEARFSFNGLAPRYYYRTCANTPVAHNGESTCGRRAPHEPRCGECYSNGSGCGNEFRSESPMGRKFIVDSLKFWASEYGVDGFRFDLLGLIDVETIQQAVEELKAIDPDIVVYGEPWIGGLSPMKTTDKGSQRSKGFAVFNDTFRNAIRGSPFDTEETFIMDGGRLMEVKGGIIGSVDTFADSPLESINYVECHDNRTLWDHLNHYIRSRTDTIKFSDEDVRRMHKLAAVLVLTSQGIPFIQAGQEMCRTKFGDENSYESPDEINMIRWSTKVEEWSTVQYYRGLILLRRAHPEIFCMENADEIHEKIVFYEDCGLHVPDQCIGYRIKGNPEKLLRRLQEERSEDVPGEQDLEEEPQRWSEVVILFNATPLKVLFELPGKEADVMWMQIVSASAAGTRTLSGPFIGSVEVSGRSAAVLRRASSSECYVSQFEMRLASIADVHCSFHGDDPLSRYAVGLEPMPTSEEQAFKNQSIFQRIQFKKKAESMDHQRVEEVYRKRKEYEQQRKL